MNTTIVGRSTFAARRQRGMAVIVVIALIGLVLILIAGNLRVLFNTGRELKLIEQRQVRRLATRTNEVRQAHSEPGTNLTLSSEGTPLKP